MAIITETITERIPVIVYHVGGDEEETTISVTREACPLYDDIPFDGSIPLEAYREPISQIADGRDAAM